MQILLLAIDFFTSFNCFLLLIIEGPHFLFVRLNKPVQTPSFLDLGYHLLHIRRCEPKCDHPLLSLWFPLYKWRILMWFQHWLLALVFSVLLLIYECHTPTCDLYKWTMENLNCIWNKSATSYHILSQGDASYFWTLFDLSTRGILLHLLLRNYSVLTLVFLLQYLSVDRLYPFKFIFNIINSTNNSYYWGFGVLGFWGFG